MKLILINNKKNNLNNLIALIKRVLKMKKRNYRIINKYKLLKKFKNIFDPNDKLNNNLNP